MHEIGCGVCLVCSSVSLSDSVKRLNSAAREVCAGDTVQPLPNHFGFLLIVEMARFPSRR